MGKWVYRNLDDSYTVFYNYESIPVWMQNDVFQVDNLPEGEGVLRQAEDGSFYYEPFSTIEPIEPDPVEPDSPQPTIEEIQLQTLLNTEFLVIMSEIEGQ